MHEVTDNEIKLETEEGTQATDLLEGSIMELIRERDDLKEQLLRTLADFQNFKRRTQSETEQLRLYANERLITNMLPILDNFERTIASFEKGASTESLVEGVKMVDKQLRSLLEDNQVAKIPAHMEAFDPDFHEAIAIEEGSEHPEGTIVQELQSGYKIGDRVIRPARVKVSKPS